ncbi:MAG: 5-(carboxyamino)imidazole ribonucleotide synthase [Gemmatimonadota bacterium]
MKVGILGGGQLGRMLALEGFPLGLDFVFLEPKEDPSVAGLGDLVQGEYDDREALQRLAEQVDVITFEFENIPVATARYLQELGLEVHPTPRALEMAQDRLAEKEGFLELEIPVAAFRPVETRQELDDAVEALGMPAVLKTRFGGYDGKGQVVIGDGGEVAAAWNELGGEFLILEQFVDFQRELSIVAARDRSGNLRAYPLVENGHRGGILRTTVAPAPDVSDDLQGRATGYLRSLMDHLGYVGVVALELFEVDGRLLANEMAPRVHNSGHWSLDGAVHSQFENHLRAVCGFPLGDTSPRGHSTMVNLLGRVPDTADLLEIPGAHLHLYDKDPRPLRKLGHVTVTGSSRDVVREGAEVLRRLVE